MKASFFTERRFFYGKQLSINNIKTIKMNNHMLP
jgi:hypothetical protein